LVELKTICHCGRAAIMNLRVDAEGQPVRLGEQVQIGGNETYVAMCRKHFDLGAAVVQPETVLN
jgi:thymidine kinase